MISFRGNHATAVTETDGGAKLLTRVAAGSEEALTEFYRAFHARVYAFAIRRLNDHAEAADVLNEVMLEVWRSAGRFEGRSRPLTWVLGIANHKALDALRRRNSRPTENLDDHDIIAEDSPTALEALAGAEDAKHLRQCLDRLSDAHRMTVHLAFFEGLSYEEVAKIAHCPVGTVKTRMYHAKQILKRCLSDGII